MKHYLLLLWVVFFPVLLVAQASQFSEKEQKKILKVFTKTFKNKQVELENIEGQLENYVNTLGMIIEADVAKQPFIDSTRIDSIELEDYVSFIITYNSDNQLYTIDANDEMEKDGSIPLMHFFNALYYGGGIESVVKSTLCTISFTTQDTLYDIEYELVNQNGSIIINNRYIQKTPQP